MGSTGPDCEGCGLAAIGSSFTEVEVGNRYESTRVLLVGEAAGQAEARDRLPFRSYAQSGSLLADALRQTHISRSEIAITNIIRCHPPNDYLEDAPYEREAISCCTSRYLSKVISELKPRVILALGGVAWRTLVNAPEGRYGTLDYVRGYVWKGAGVAMGIPVIPTYHPAFIRRGAAELTPLLWRDLQRSYMLGVGKLVEGQHYYLRPHEKVKYQAVPTEMEAWAWLDEMDPSLPLSYDIETPWSGKSDEADRTASSNDGTITLVQFSQSRGKGIAVPYRDGYVQFVKQSFANSRVRVGFNNWVFDDPRLEAAGVEVGETEDAMVMFGPSYWSDLPKNLQTSAQMSGFPFPWKHLHASEYEWYGCADVDATLAVYEYALRVLSGVETK